jgi:hypothetical protein
VDGSDFVYEIDRVHNGGNEVDLQFPNTNPYAFPCQNGHAEIFRAQGTSKTSNPLTTPEHEINAADTGVRVSSVQEEISNRWMMTSTSLILSEDSACTQSSD